MEISAEDLKRRLDSGEALALIDVREPLEHAQAHIEGAELIPMNTIPEHLDALREKSAASPLIVLCHHGVRSLRVVEWLRRQGVGNCWSMAGGIDYWSAAIDRTVPRYWARSAIVAVSRSPAGIATITGTSSPSPAPAGTATLIW